MFVAILAVFILPDLPHNTRGFTEEERYVAQLRMTEDVGVADSDEPNQGVFTGLIMALKDAKVYLMMFTLTAYVVGLSFNAFFVSGSLPFYIATRWTYRYVSLPNYSPRLPALWASTTSPRFS
jgi:hypothetical protein